MKKRYWFVNLVIFLILLFGCIDTVFSADYSFKSVWNERISYDPTYFDLGTFNDIVAGAIIADITVQEAESIAHTVKWTPTGGSQQEGVLSYGGEQPLGQTFIYVLEHNAAAASFSAWEEISYDFLIDDVSQAPSVSVSSGSFQELSIPKAAYDHTTKTLTWQAVESRNYRVRILGSTDQDDILFDSATIVDSETYQFTDPAALDLLDDGAIIAVEARQIKSSTELFNTSIYITKYVPYSFKSVWNEHISYDPSYFNLGTFNDIMAGAIIPDLTESQAASINHTVKWTPSGGTQQEGVLSYEGEQPTGQTFIYVLDHDVAAASFSEWEEIDYDYFIDDVLQEPSVSVSSGSFQELSIPKAAYDHTTKTLTWQAVESRNYRVRILGSTDQDDILFDSATIVDSETYQFTDPAALDLLDDGAIIAVEARQIKSSTELFNTSIYITKYVLDSVIDDSDDEGSGGGGGGGGGCFISTMNK